MKGRALIEVVFVFALTLLLVALAGLSPIGIWERQVTSRPFVEYSVMIGVPLVVLFAARRDVSSYGLSLRDAQYHLDVAATIIVPVTLASAALALVDYTHWSGALVLSGVNIALLFVVAWLLKSKPSPTERGIQGCAIVLVTGVTLVQGLSVANAISAFVFYVFFLGFGEELLFRGYVQSRLNAGWGRPFQFYRIDWGWGVVVASVLFGVMHVLNLGSLVGGDWQLEWWWGLWTFFSGLVYGLVREKTGSIVAPTILHGLPDAIAAALGLL